MGHEVLFETLLGIKREREENEKALAEIRQPFLDDISKIQVAMAEATTKLDNVNIGLNDHEKGIKEELVNNWPFEDKVYDDPDTGIKLQKRKSEKPEVLDLRGLLEKVLTFDELPIKKVNFDNRKLITLTQAGVISSDMVEILKSYNIAITFPKE